jgi:neutral amino acid transport system permease protein
VEAGTLIGRAQGAHPGLHSAANALRRHPGRVLAGLLGVIGIALIATEGLQSVAQVTINGLIAGSYFALAAVGLTLVYGILRLVNFAHGDFLTFGAYMALLFGVGLDLPVVLALLLGVVATAALGVATELALWRPMRRKGAGLLQMLIISIGLAFVIRNGIQLVAGTEPRELNVDVTSSIGFLGLRVGRTELVVGVIGLLALVAVAVMLRRTLIGKQMRALADNFDLAEVTGIDTERIVLFTWILAGGLAGLAGILYASVSGVFTPNLGFALLLTMFSAVILGGIGRVYGALVGGLVLGLAQEWSTLVIAARWKELVSFAILILVLTIRPQGIFGVRNR